MTVEEIGICITVVLSTISLIVSLANYQKNKPKLKIEITDKKWDCFFGRTIHDNNITRATYICGAQISIVNNSPVAITVSNATMLLRKEKLRLIDNQNDYWECVEFFFTDDSGDLTTDGSGIYYQESGLALPCKINAYDTITVFVLFHNFPAKIRNRCKGTLVLNTAVGKIKRKITMIERDKNYQEADYRDYLSYCRSLEEIKR